MTPPPQQNCQKEQPAPFLEQWHVRRHGDMPWGP